MNPSCPDVPPKTFTFGANDNVTQGTSGSRLRRSRSWFGRVPDTRGADRVGFPMSPSCPDVPPKTFTFGANDNVTQGTSGSRLRRSRSWFGRDSDGESSDDDGEFELESFPLTQLSLGVWHAKTHVGLRIVFATGRFVFVVVRRRRVLKPGTFVRTVERVKRTVKRHFDLDMPLSPFSVNGRTRTGREDVRGVVTGAGTSSARIEKENENATTSAAENTSVRFVQGTSAADPKTMTHPTRRASTGKHNTRRESTHDTKLVLTYEIKHDDVVGLNYANALCLDGRLAVEAKKVTKRAFQSFEQAVAFFSRDEETTASGGFADNAPARCDDAGYSFVPKNVHPGGVGRGGARRSVTAGTKNDERDAKHKRARCSAHGTPVVTRLVEASYSEPPFDDTSKHAQDDKVPSPQTPPRHDEAPTLVSREPFLESKNDDAGVFSTPAVSGVFKRDSIGGRLGGYGSYAQGAHESNAAPSASPPPPSETFKDVTLFAFFDDALLPDALRKRVMKKQRLLTLYEDGIPVWALVFAQFGVYYRPWLRTVFRVVFIALTVFSAITGVRDLRNMENSAESSSKNFSLSLVGLISGFRLGLVDPKTVRTLLTLLNAVTKSATRVLMFIAYVAGRLTIHRLSIAMAIGKFGRALPKTFAKAHFGSKKRVTDDTYGTSGTATSTSAAFSSPAMRHRKPRTPALGVATAGAARNDWKTD